MVNFTSTPKCLPMGVIVAKISALVKIRVLGMDSCVDDCANQDHSFEALCSENADFLLLLEKAKIR